VFTLGANFRSGFLDTDAVKRQIGEGKRKVLTHFGGRVRTEARFSMAKKAGRKTYNDASAPGTPPYSHEGSLRRNIFFAYDPAADSVVIGPTALNKIAFDQGMQPISGLIPQILEFGGTAGVIEQATRDTKTDKLVWVRRDLRRYGKLALVAKLRGNLAKGNVFRVGPNLVVPTGRHRFRTYQIAPRPYMRPAFDRAIEALAPLWAGSVTSGAASTGQAA
jgi:hypothetical protein